MALKSSRFLPALKQLPRSVQKSATPGERIMGKLFPNRGTGYPGGWSQDRIQQVQHMTDWTYVAVHTICMKVASIMPNMAWVVDAPRPGVTVKANQRGMLNSLGRGFGGTTHLSSRTDYGKGPSVTGWQGGRYGVADGLAGSSGTFLTIGEYRSKALSVLKPHDDLEPLPSDHLLRRLIENPNAVDTAFDYRYELLMFKLLCGVAYEWVLPNAFGQPCERWVIPSHWVWPRTGGQEYVDPEHPDADRLIQYYEVRPWGGLGSAGMLRLPPDQVIPHIFKSPINKLDGYAKLWAISKWIDTEESISNSRWAQFINQARPEFWIQMGPEFVDPDDNLIARWEAKIAQKHQGEYNMHKPLFMPAGATAQVLSFSPEEMCYFNSEEQIRDMILSAFGVPKSAVGVVSDMTFGSVLATMMAFCENCINPLLAQEGQVETKHLASRFDEPGRKCRLWYDNCTPADPAQVNSDLSTDMSCHAITPNEIRALRGRKSYRLGGDNPLVQGPGGLMPLPINVEESMDDLGELVAMYTDQVAGKKDADKLATQQSNEDIPPKEVSDVDDGSDPADVVDDGVGADSGAGKRPSVEDLAEGAKVEEPNGKPAMKALHYQKSRVGSELPGGRRRFKKTEWRKLRVIAEPTATSAKIVEDEDGVKWQWQEASAEYVIAARVKALASVYKSLEEPETLEQPLYDYCSTMIVLDGAKRKEILRLGELIADEDLHAKGREDNPHITVRYGLHEDDPGSVRELVETFGPVEAKLGSLDCFPGAEYDVIIVRVESDDLHALHSLLGELPNTQTFPEYNPHATIAYVEPGLGQYYVDLLTGETEDEQGVLDDEPEEFTQLVFSSTSGQLTSLGLASYEWAESDEQQKGVVFDSLKGAGRWLARKWESLEARYGRTGALTMAVAMLATMPIPFNIAAVIAAAEAIRGVRAHFESVEQEWSSLDDGGLPIEERYNEQLGKVVDKEGDYEDQWRSLLERV